MAAKTILLLILEIVLGLVLFPIIGASSLLIFLGLAILTILLARRSSRKSTWVPGKGPVIITPQQPMKLRTFISLLGVVALVAILFSPSALSFSTGGGSAPQVADSFKAIMPYVADLKSRYSSVYIANDSFSLVQALNKTGTKAYFLIGPDNGMNLTLDESNMIKRQYINGTLSLLISEGNYTNTRALLNLFDVYVKGDAVVDYTSPFPDQKVFNATANLAGQTLPFVIDIGSPILFGNHTTMHAIGSSSNLSNDTSSDPIVRSNKTLAPRVVVAAAQHNANRAILISDSGPFNTIYNRTWTDLTPNVNETAFTWALTNWVTNSNPNTAIILDNTHYSINYIFHTPPTTINIPIGRLFAVFLAFVISFTSGLYTGFVGFFQPLILGVALFVTWGFYGTLTSKYSNEPRGKDDEPLPKIEKNVRAESLQRLSFLDKTMRTKGFYIATLAQLYDALNAVIQKEFGIPIAKLNHEQLINRLGPEQAPEAVHLINNLTAIVRYADGKTRFLFPPLTGWKRRTRALTREAERLLNQLGISMVGKVQKRQLEYKLRRA